jgi:hypothetical protein
MYQKPEALLSILAARKCSPWWRLVRADRVSHKEFFLRRRRQGRVPYGPTTSTLVLAETYL